MLKTIKKLFSVDDSDLDFDTEESVEQAQPEQNTQQHSIYTNNANEQLEQTKTNIQGINITELQPSQETIKNEQTQQNRNPQTQGNIAKAMPEVVTHNIKSDAVEEKISQQTTDFQQEIEQAFNQGAIIPESKPAGYDQELIAKQKELEAMQKQKEQEAKAAASKAATQPKAQPKTTAKTVKKAAEKTVEKEEKANTKKFKPRDVSELVSKDTFKLQDIIKPMSGVSKKANNEVLEKNEPKPQKTGIIKLRENLKITDLEKTDSLDDVVEEVSTKQQDVSSKPKAKKDSAEKAKAEPTSDSLTAEFETLKAKNKESVAKVKEKEKEKNNKHQSTNRFIIVEDSTGEMTLVYDEDNIKE